MRLTVTGRIENLGTVVRNKDEQAIEIAKQWALAEVDARRVEFMESQPSARAP